MSPRRRGVRFTAGELRLTVLAGIMLGLIAVQLPGGAAPTVGDPFDRSGGRPKTPSPVGPLEFGAAGVIDGDTFRHAGETIRIADIDTPETHPPRCASEAELGARATRRLEELLAAGGVELLPAPDGRDSDRYGRKLRIVKVNGRSVGDTLVAEGLARAYAGGRRPWCA